MKKLLILIFVISGLLNAVEKSKEYEPNTNLKNKISIAYYQGGDYSNYPLVLKSVINNLSEYGWLEPIDLDQEKTAKEIWDKLSSKSKSDHLEFKQDAYYDAQWNKNDREKVLKKFLTRTTEKNDIDFVFALGTWAGQDLSNDKHHIPSFVMSVSNPISAGILQNANKASFPHIHARVDQKRYKRQVSLFHKIIQFKNLGVVYEDSKQGKSYASLQDIEELSREKNFNINKCRISSDSNSMKNDLIKCYKQVSKNSDAIYITTHPSYKANDLELFINDINKKNIPTFSQVGQSHVKYGALMSISRANFKYLGRFHAQMIAKAFNGDKLSSLEFVFEEPAKLAINIKTSEIIDWDIPLGIISICDEVYQKIESKRSLSLK